MCLTGSEKYSPVGTKAQPRVGLDLWSSACSLLYYQTLLLSPRLVQKYANKRHELDEPDDVTTWLGIKTPSFARIASVRTMLCFNQFILKSCCVGMSSTRFLEWYCIASCHHLEVHPVYLLHWYKITAVLGSPHELASLHVPISSPTQTRGRIPKYGICGCAASVFVLL